MQGPTATSCPQTPALPVLCAAGAVDVHMRHDLDRLPLVPQRLTAKRRDDFLHNASTALDQLMEPNKFLSCVCYSTLVTSTTCAATPAATLSSLLACYLTVSLLPALHIVLPSCLPMLLL